MAITVKHKFVSAIPDGTDATVVRPSNWNDDHDLVGTVPVANGGTGTTTANDAFNALAPTQTGNSGKYLTTDGTNTSWATNPLGTVTSVAATVPSFLNVTGSPITTSGTLAIGYSGTALPVANGGTGVTSSSGANSVVLRDANANITTNCLFEGFSTQAASGTAIVLTASSVQNWQITGSGGQTIRLPDATTLPNGATFTFNNNQSSGSIVVQNNSSTTVATINSGGYVTVVLLSNSIAAGSWDRHDSTPSNVSWSTNTLDYPGSITSATWNGNVVAINRGGTGQATASAAFNALSPLTTAGDVLYGGTSGAGTRLGIGTAGQVLTVNAGATAPQWSTPTTGTVTSVGTAGTVNGLTLTGGPITSTGTVTLGGTLDLSSPPTIGNTAANTGKFTTLESTGTASLGTTSTTYIQAIGDASYPGVYAAGGTNTPLVLQPLGTGALQAQKTTSSSTGGNARGANAVDWQTGRDLATRVAVGTYSVVGGGYSNTANAYQSNVAGGAYNLTQGNNNFIGGGSTNTANGGYLQTNSAIVGGYSNTANGFYNFIGAGYANTGTANSAVTTQSATMNGTTAVTLGASNASIKVGQYITGTSIAQDTYVAAVSGTSLTLSKVASGSSTSTLSFYTPHGVVVGGGNNQATGSYAFIGGGGDAGTAANRNVASGDWSFVGGGTKNTASGLSSVVAGGGYYGANSAGGPGAFIAAGWANNASGAGTACLGIGGLANADYSSVLGGSYGTARSIQGNTVFVASNTPLGTAYTGQASLLILSRQTTDATATVLCSNASAAGSTNQVILPDNSAYYFKVRVIAGVTGAGNTKAWTLEGAIKRGVGVGTTAIVGTVTTTIVAQDAGASAWAVTATADTTNGGLKITVTGQASTTIRWVAKAESVEMTF